MGTIVQLAIIKQRVKLFRISALEKLLCPFRLHRDSCLLRWHNAREAVPLSGGVAEYTISTLASGKHTITATYNGSTDFTGSSDSLTQTLTAD